MQRLSAKGWFCLLLLFTILGLVATKASAQLSHLPFTGRQLLPRFDFVFPFSGEMTVEETASPEISTSPHWWVNSGGMLVIKDGTGMTIQGAIDGNSRWFKEYAVSNPIDTDNGVYPQNIFRLVTRTGWKNYVQENFFKITAFNNSTSPERNASNGILFFGRYKDGNNLYYAGMRVDGTYVIKKKINGSYYTLAQSRYNSALRYNREAGINLIPKDTWIGLKVEIKTIESNKVSLKLYSDIGRKGVWTLVSEAVDSGLGGDPILEEGRGGIRTDFMDVLFDDYRVKKL